MPRRLGLIPLVALTLFLAGCTKSSPKSDAVAPVATSAPESSAPVATTTPPVAETTLPPVAGSPTVSVSATPKLESGSHFGYVKSVNAGSSPSTLTIDFADLFTGAAADKAAAEDGVIQPGQHVENDYYIRNKNPKLRTFKIAPSATVKLLPRSSDGTMGTEPDLRTVAFFLSIYSSTPPAGYTGDVTQIAYNIAYTNGVVTSITEVFFP